MFAYAVRRVLIGVVLLVLMSLVTFLLFFATPINFAQRACGKSCPPAQIAQVKKQLGYDQPVLVQWSSFMKGLVEGRQYPADKELAKAAPQTIVECPAPCLGYSTYQTSLVTTLIKSGAPVSFSLAVVAYILWITGGVLFGVTAALKKGTLIDRGIVGASLLFYAFPTFFIGLLFLQFVAIDWALVPLPTYQPLTEYGIGLWLQGLFLPALTLALVYMAGYTRMTRAFVLESMGEDYIRTARAKGLPARKVTFKHSLRAALTPLLTLSGLDLAQLLGGAIITEYVYNFNGLGLLTVQSARNFDLPTTVALVVLLASFVIMANVIVDLLYAVVDPRVRLG